MSDLAGKTFLITGANTGIGRVTAETLADRGGRVILAGRSKERTQEVIDTISGAHGAAQVSFVPLDLGDFDSIKSATKTILEMNEPIHCLINNAGLAGIQGSTKSGFEIQFGVNHVGHFLFTIPLIDRIKESGPGARIVVVASQAHYKTDGIDFDAVERATKTKTGFPEYCVSKLANVLFTSELSKRLEGTGINAYSLHPGVVASDIWRRVPALLRFPMKWFMISNEEGAQTTLHCATSDAVKDETGLYYDKCKSKKTSSAARDEELAKKLWEKSVEWTGVDL